MILTPLCSSCRNGSKYTYLGKEKISKLEIVLFLNKFRNLYRIHKFRADHMACPFKTPRRLNT